jgi:2'-5' RNA ligase
MRLFIALDIPEDARAELEKAQQYVQRSRSHPVKWVATKNCHVTLQFLGDVNDRKVPELLRALDDVETSLHPAPGETTGQAWLPRLALAPVGAFPNLKRPQTIWMGLGGDVATLQQLQQAVAQALEPHGFAPDKRFHPHLTIGRVRRDANKSEVDALAKALATLVPPPEHIVWQSGPPVLFQSTLTPAGPIYTRLS